MPVPDFAAQLQMYLESVHEADTDDGTWYQNQEDEPLRVTDRIALVRNPLAEDYYAEHGPFLFQVYRHRYTRSSPKSRAYRGYRSYETGYPRDDVWRLRIKVDGIVVYTRRGPTPAVCAYLARGFLVQYVREHHRKTETPA